WRGTSAPRRITLPHSRVMGVPGEALGAGGRGPTHSRMCHGRRSRRQSQKVRKVAGQSCNTEGVRGDSHPSVFPTFERPVPLPVGRHGKHIDIAILRCETGAWGEARRGTPWGKNGRAATGMGVTGACPGRV